MHKPKIFLVGDNKEHLITLEETGYVEEAVLQDYLVDYPDLLPGDQIDPENPRRWLLVAQEMGVPDEQDGSGRWSLDHLFLDQDGIPTFVECKRAVDTRARREVVAQMLDYAANGIEYWTLDRLRQAAPRQSKNKTEPLTMRLPGCWTTTRQTSRSTGLPWNPIFVPTVSAWSLWPTAPQKSCAGWSSS